MTSPSAFFPKRTGLQVRGRRFPFRLLSLLLACGLLLPSVLQAQVQGDALVEVREANPGDLRAAAFQMNRDAYVEVQAVGPAAHREDYGLSNAWILDSDTREVVWELETAEVEERERYLRTATTTLLLPAGAYEVYYAFFPSGPYYDDLRERYGLSDDDFIRRVMDEIFDRDNLSEWDDFYRRHGHAFGITIRSEAENLQPLAMARARERFADRAFVTQAPLGNGRTVQQGFRLQRPMEVGLYALGELLPYTALDYGWIVDTNTLERVWTMNFRRTQHGGGATKNRMAREVLRLPEGEYAAFFITDRAHAYETWSAAPPYDPAFWGLTLLPEDPAMRPYVERFAYEHRPTAEALAALTGLGDRTERSARFTLDEERKVRIYALGEGRDGELSDYGWIDDAETGERVWTMRFPETDHAGGNEKNRYLNDVVRLPAGTYEVHFVTDPSHSAAGWNATPPFDPASWGITVLPAAPDAVLIPTPSYEMRRRLSERLSRR